MGIRQVVIASTWGDTALQALPVFEGFKIAVVGIVIGPKEHAKEDTVVRAFPSEVKKAVVAAGGTVLNATHVFGGVTRALREQMNWSANPISLVGAALRVFGCGMKVALEVSMMATDAGMLDPAEEAVAIAGSGRCADTAVVLRPVNAHRFFNLKVKEIICKPRLD